MKSLIVMTLGISFVTLTGCSSIENFQAGRLPHAFSSHGSEEDPFANSYSQEQKYVQHNTAAPRGFAAVTTEKTQPANKRTAHQTGYPPQAEKTGMHNESMQIARDPALFQQAGFEQSAADISKLKNPFGKENEKPPVLNDSFNSAGEQTAHFETSAAIPPEPPSIDEQDYLLQQSSATSNPFAAEQMAEPTAPIHKVSSAENPFANTSESKASELVAPAKTVIQHIKNQQESDQWRKSDSVQQKQSVTTPEKGFVLPSSFQAE